MIGKWVLVAGAALVMGGGVAFFVGHARETAKAVELDSALLRGASPPPGATVDFETFAELPPPVARYLRYALSDGQALIARAAIHQSGTLRTSIDAENWYAFVARQLAAPPRIGFLWNARVEMAPAIHIRVLDAYIDGIGSGRVSLWSAFPLDSQAGAPELSSGALHRYLAEAVWYPTALLPQSGVRWTAIDDQSALATLGHRGTSVSLEFRFNSAGAVTGVFAPGRYGTFEGEYRLTPWEGHFADYHEHEGMRVPGYGEVGWYDNGSLRLVWKGRITRLRYAFGS